MSKIEIPIEEVEVGGVLFNFYYNNCMIRSDVVKTTSETLATAVDNFKLSIAEVNTILNRGGEVYEYLMAVRAPIALLDTDVPDGLPKNKYFDETYRTFRTWLAYGAEVWVDQDPLIPTPPPATEVILYTNPFAGNEDQYLTGSEISIINQIGGSVSILTVANAEIVTATGWTKL